MTKQELPKVPTYFLNFNRDSIEHLIKAIISKYDIHEVEIEYLKTEVSKFPADRILYWIPQYREFHYVSAHGRFLNYCWLNHDEPEVEVLHEESDNLEFVYTDKINTDIFDEFDTAHAIYG